MSERKILHDFVFNLVVPIILSLSFIIWRAVSLEDIYANPISVNDFALNFLKDFFLFLILPILIMMDIYHYFSRHGTASDLNARNIKMLARAIYLVLFVSFLFQLLF